MSFVSEPFVAGNVGGQQSPSTFVFIPDGPPPLPQLACIPAGFLGNPRGFHYPPHSCSRTG